MNEVGQGRERRDSGILFGEEKGRNILAAGKGQGLAMKKDKSYPVTLGALRYVCSAISLPRAAHPAYDTNAVAHQAADALALALRLVLPCAQGSH